MEVARKVLIGCEAYKDVGKAHRISVSRVTAIASKVRKKRLVVKALFQN